ncbi:MAG: SlyX family protein [Planctomycetota bacterium]
MSAPSERDQDARPAELANARITELEIQLAHLSRSYDQLNEVVVEQDRSVEIFKRMIKKLQSKVSDLEHATSKGDFDFSGGEATEGHEFGFDSED